MLDVRTSSPVRHQGWRKCKRKLFPVVIFDVDKDIDVAIVFVCYCFWVGRVLAFGILEGSPPCPANPRSSPGI